MKPFEPIELAPDVWLDTDQFQWILRKHYRTQGGELVRDKRTGSVKSAWVRYYATLPALLRAFGEYRLRTTHHREWGKVVEEMDRIQAELTKAVSRAWVA